MQTGTDNLSKIQGQLERITFANEENGFTIALVSDAYFSELPILHS